MVKLSLHLFSASSNLKWSFDSTDTSEPALLGPYAFDRHERLHVKGVFQYVREAGMAFAVTKHT